MGREGEREGGLRTSFLPSSSLRVPYARHAQWSRTSVKDGQMERRERGEMEKGEREGKVIEVVRPPPSSQQNFETETSLLSSVLLPIFGATRSN